MNHLKPIEKHRKLYFYENTENGIEKDRSRIMKCIIMI